MCANGTAGRRETRCAKNPRDIVINVNGTVLASIAGVGKETDQRSLIRRGRLGAVRMTSRTGARGDASPLGLVPTLRAQLHVFRLQLVQRFLHVMELFGLDIGQLFEVGQVRGCLAVRSSRHAWTVGPNEPRCSAALTSRGTRVALVGFATASSRAGSPGRLIPVSRVQAILPAFVPATRWELRWPCRMSRSSCVCGHVCLGR